MKELIKSTAKALIGAEHVVALTGAGISTESGIPDFRGPQGIWTKNPEAERKAYQAYSQFLADPKGYWKGRLSTPGLLGDLSRFEPNPGHYALAELEKMGLLHRVITQNIDNLHRKAGSIRILEYHGNAFMLRCISCGSRFDGGVFNLDKLRKEDRLPPSCPQCGQALKADVVHFGEPIPGDVIQQSLEEAQKCDLMLICGTSAAVYPFAELPAVAHRKKGAIIEINAEPTPLTERKVSTYLIQGKTGEVLPQIVKAAKNLRH